MSEESTGEHCSPVVRRVTRENLHLITEPLIISCNCCFYNITAFQTSGNVQSAG